MNALAIAKRTPCKEKSQVSEIDPEEFVNPCLSCLDLLWRFQGFQRLVLVQQGVLQGLKEFPLELIDLLDVSKERVDLRLGDERLLLKRFQI